MTKGRDRVVCVPLSEAEWTALVAAHPEPVAWLRDLILAEIDAARELPKPQPPLKGHAKPWSARRV